MIKEEEIKILQEEIIEESPFMSVSSFTKNKKTDDYYIYDKNGLDAFNTFFNSKDIRFENATVHLKADIEYFGDWNPLNCTNSRSANFTFDGEGHTVEGLYLKKSAVAISGNEPIGFFGDVEQKVTIKNVKFIGARLAPGVTYAKWAGVVVGYHIQSALVIENVTVERCTLLPADSGSKKIGGVVGFSSYQNSSGNYSLKISGCTVKDSEFSGDISVAGISGTILNYYELMVGGNTVKVENCSVSGCTFTVNAVLSQAAKDPVSVYVVDETREKNTENQDLTLFGARGCTEENNEIIKK